VRRRRRGVTVPLVPVPAQAPVQVTVILVVVPADLNQGGRGKRRNLLGSRARRTRKMKRTILTETFTIFIPLLGSLSSGISGTS